MGQDSSTRNRRKMKIIGFLFYTLVRSQPMTVDATYLISFERICWIASLPMRSLWRNCARLSSVMSCEGNAFRITDILWRDSLIQRRKGPVIRRFGNLYVSSLTKFFRNIRCSRHFRPLNVDVTSSIAHDSCYIAPCFNILKQLRVLCQLMNMLTCTNHRIKCIYCTVVLSPSANRGFPVDISSQPYVWWSLLCVKYPTAHLNFIRALWCYHWVFTSLSSVHICQIRED